MHSEIKYFFLTCQLFQGERFIPPGRKDQKGTLIILAV